VKTITIQIQVPDGVEVRVSQGGQARQARQGSSRPFQAQPDPPFPQWDPTCPQHGVEWNLVPAGVSKKAVDDQGNPKRYNAFWACPERGCNEKPERMPDGYSPDDEGYVDQLPF
jgi:hypothetical protein